MFHEINRQRRGHDLISLFREGLYPALYETEDIPLREKLVVEHFFGAGCDWWMTEFDPETNIAFGFASLGDDQMAEWGNFSLDELEGLLIPIEGAPPIIIERELGWLPRSTLQAIPERFHRDWWSRD